jgi:ATP-dependent DNA helicase DinG
VEEENLGEEEQVRVLREEEGSEYGAKLRLKEEEDLGHEEERVLDFPYSQKDKIDLFAQKLTFKKDQARYANLVYKFFHENSMTRNFFLEATPGIGKSIGYLFPMSFYATKEKPLIVSTSSTFLQQQLLKEAVVLINKVIPYKLKATLVKARENYIDLAAFARTLDCTLDQKQFVVYQMAVLVWLLETKTGDLDELAQKNESHLFFKQIAHKGIYNLNPQNPFYEVDFLRLQKKRIKNSNLLLTTHEFLVQDHLCKTPLLPASDGLILDEAHQLPSILQKATRVSLNLMQILRNIKLLTNQNTGLLNLYPVDSLNEILLDIFSLISSMLEKIDLEDEHKQNFEFHDNFLLKEKENLKICLADLGKVYKNFEKTLKNELSLEQLFWYEDIDELLLSILQDLLNLIFLIEAKGSQYSKDISWSKEENVPLLQMVDFSVNSLIESNWRRRYPKILYTSATLTTWKNREFLPKSLQLTNYEVKKINSSDSQKKEDLINVYLPLVHGLAYENIEILSDFLKEVIYTHKRRILVLFSDLDSLTKMYHYFYKLARTMGYELFAQTISGRKEKLVQCFLSSESALLFGADAFWEGIDFPAGTLDIVIIMRIPLDYKKKKRNLDFANYLEEKGKDPFQDYFLPNAAMLLRQAFARLMRSNGKRVAFIFLDHRIRVEKYSRILENALPQGITFLAENTTKTIKALDKHLVFSI